MVTESERQKRRDFLELLGGVERGMKGADGQYELGLAYLYGKSAIKDVTLAYYWIRRAAEQGHASAQCHLGVMYNVGQSVQRDPIEAVKWYRRAAEQGIGSAMFNLGQAYNSGNGVPESASEAVKWYRNAAQKHEAFSDTRNRALYFLGKMYLEGRGVPQSVVCAYSLWLEAASLGFREPEDDIEKLKERMTMHQLAEAKDLDYKSLL